MGALHAKLAQMTAPRSSRRPQRRLVETPQQPASLREQLKRHTRARLEAATVQMLRRHGFRAMSVDQIARAAGTTRTTFYQYFKSKGALIHFLQDAYIEPEMVAISRRLDQMMRRPSWRKLRNWVIEYAHTWDRIHLFLEAYGDALLTDPAVAATAIPDTYRVTASMTGILSRFEGEQRARAHAKLVTLIVVVPQIRSLARARGEDARTSPLLDIFTDLFWDGFFAHLPALARPSLARAEATGRRGRAAQRAVQTAVLPPSTDST